MLESKKNERDANALESFLSDWRMRLAFFIFAAPFLAVFFLSVLGVPTTSFQPILFFCGITAEFLLWFILWRAYNKNKINRSETGRYIYLVYTILGLPFTIYLTQSYGHSLAAFIRFSAVLILLFDFVPRSAVKLHIILFFCGFFLYQFLQAGSGFGTKEGGLMLSYALGTVFIWYREKYALEIQKKFLSLSLYGRRWEKKYTQLHIAFMKLLKAAGSPQTAKQILQKKPVHSKCGTYILLSFFFSDMNKSFWNFQMNSTFSETRAVYDFQREWDIFLDHTRQKISALDLEFSIGADNLIAGRLLAPHHKEDKNEIILNAKQKELLFQIFFQVHELLQFSTRTRSSIEHRGSTGWYTTALLGVGFAGSMPSSLENPALVFRGPLVKTLHESYSLLEKGRWKKSQNEGSTPLQDNVWIQPLLEPLYRPRFDMSTSPVCAGWKSPEFLLSEYTQDRSRLRPNPSFWASLAADEVYHISTF